MTRVLIDLDLIAGDTVGDIEAAVAVTRDRDGCGDAATHSEDLIASQLTVSRQPVMDSMRRLAIEGHVTPDRSTASS